MSIKPIKAKALKISNSAPLSRLHMLAIMRKLPKDAIITEIFNDWMSSYRFTVTSETYPELTPGETVPDMGSMGVSYEELLNEQDFDTIIEKGLLPSSKPTKTHGAYSSSTYTKISDSCICDFDYTGLKAHKYNCPKNTRGKK